MTNFNVTSVLSVLMAIPAFVKLIRELMVSVQTEFGPGSGPDKKRAVLDSLLAIIGDEAIWAKVQGIFSVLIDCLSIFKPKDVIK